MEQKEKLTRIDDSKGSARLKCMQFESGLLFVGILGFHFSENLGIPSALRPAAPGTPDRGASGNWNNGV